MKRHRAAWRRSAIAIVIGLIFSLGSAAVGVCWRKFRTDGTIYCVIIKDKGLATLCEYRGPATLRSVVAFYPADPDLHVGDLSYYRKIPLEEVKNTRVRDFIGGFATAAPGAYSTWSIDERGWPFYVLGSTTVLNADESVGFGRGSWAAVFSGKSGYDWAKHYFIPLDVRYLGLIGDVFVYGVLFWGMDMLRWRLLVKARHRRGLCVQCKYNRNGLSATDKCPECGLALVS